MPEGHASSWPFVARDFFVGNHSASVQISQMPSRLVRHAPAHLPLRHSGNRSEIIFLTVCTDNRKRILAHPESHRTIVAAWEASSAWIVGRYVIMPDHIHLFCSPGGFGYHAVTRWVQYWKSLVSKRWPWPSEQPIWQKSCWDTQLRRGDSYGTKWEYVRMNPVRHGLVANVDTWPFQGELNVLQWHD